MLRVLDRYVIREILTPFFLGLLVFTFILEIPPVMQVAEGLIAKGVPPGAIVRIMLTLLPQALGLTIPMAVLIGLLIGLGRLSADRETVAMQACGVSITRLLRPVAVVALAAWAATSYVFIRALPDANQTFREITYRIVSTRAEHDVKPRVFFEDFPNIVLYVRDVPPEGGWSGVFLADTRTPLNPDIYLARRGRVFLDPVRRSVALRLEDGSRHRTTPDLIEKYTSERFERATIRLDPDTVFPRAGPQRGDPELTIAELKADIERRKAQGVSPHRQIMTIHQKFAIPLACLVFAVIGLSLGITNRRDGKLASFVLGIGVIFVYYVIMYVAEAMVKGAMLSPHVAMWLPDGILGVAGIVLLWGHRRAPERRIALPLPSRLRNRLRPATGRRMAGPRRARVRVVVRVPRTWTPRVNILDWYIARFYARVLVLAFAAMLGLFYISTFIDLSDKLFKGQASGVMLLQYLWFATPQFIYYVLAISALVAALVTVGGLTKNSELVVMKACGISLYRAAAPLLFFGLLWSGTLFVLEESILPPANRRAAALRNQIRFGSSRTFDVLNRKWLVARNGSIYHYLDFDPKRSRLDGLSVYELDPKEWRLLRRTFISQATFAGQSWQARKGWSRQFDAAANAKTFQPFAGRRLALEPPDYFATEQPDAERMTYPQLKRYITELQASGFSVVRYSVELQRKLSFPLVTVIMTLIAVPFAVTTGRRGALYGIGAGLMLAITYWILNSVFGAIGTAGLLSPVLAAWAPNILFATGASFLVLSART